LARVRAWGDPDFRYPDCYDALAVGREIAMAASMPWHSTIGEIGKRQVLGSLP
jgi:hypothetical protein